jgi:hypothetical protein
MANIDKNFRVKNGLDVKGTINLAAIAASKSETAVDVFVYDTSKDTDGGAWRHRTQHTSWYNETLNTSTRGSRKEFPAVAVIVAETDKVTIYDGDDPSLPMWMVFNAGALVPLYNLTTITSLHFANGKCVVGQAASVGIAVFDLISDEYFSRRNNTTRYSFTNILGRNGSSVVTTVNFFDQGLVNSAVNDVAMTVLPDAPVDPATGLPVPTIAVATDGGVSVIKDDGTVVDPPPYVAKHSKSIDIGKNGDLFNDGVFVTTWSDSYTPYDNGNWSSGQHFSSVGNYPTTRFGSSTNQSNIIVTPYGFAGEGMMPDNNSPMLYQMMLDPSDVRDGSAVAYTTSDYNTGWINGDIKGAFLSDTDDTNLVGSGELVTNGDDFNGVVNGTSTLPTGATNVGWYETSNGTYSVTNGVLTITIGTNGRTGFYWPISVVQGALYEAEWVAQTGNIQVRITDSIDPNDTTPLRIFNLGSTGKKTFVSPSSTLYVSVTNYDTGQGDVGTLDKISVKLADADRSVNNNALIVNGTVTRTAVATGADLVAYSGFSPSNYLEQPYNSDLDFGTGDFCVMGWATASATSDWIVDRKTPTVVTSAGFEVFQFDGDATSGTLRIITRLGGSSNTQTVIGTVTSSFTHFVAARRSGVMETYINGVFQTSNADTRDITNTNASLFVGVQSDLTSSYTNGSLALLRISATAPTAAQIKKIYEDEKFLFQENAQATLYGTSDAVTALDHDEDTGLLHVGTSAGRSVFQGLRRVDNTTDAVGTAISVVDGLVVEE